jgi:hypothetical protein
LVGAPCGSATVWVCADGSGIRVSAMVYSSPSW